jgi:hypothetical protein
MYSTRQSFLGRLAAIWADMTNAHAAIGHITPSEQAAAPISASDR